MEERTLAYFVSDVHLGLDVKDPSGREARFVRFLRSIPAERTKALFLLGDIWDFWYEYEAVVPKGFVRVFSALTDLIDAGVEVCFFHGNHDMWSYNYFRDMGMKIMEQPAVVEMFGKKLCMAHGDGFDPSDKGYRIMNAVFHSKIARFVFSTLHPTLAFRLSKSWSKGHRLKTFGYQFRGEEEPLYKFADNFSRENKVDAFIFGHYHASVDMTLPGGERFIVLDSWMDGDDYWYLDGITGSFGHSPNTEK